MDETAKRLLDTLKETTKKTKKFNDDIRTYSVELDEVHEYTNHIIANYKREISLVVNEYGKPAFANPDSREGELQHRLDNNEHYESYLNKTKKVKLNLEVAKGNLYNEMNKRQDIKAEIDLLKIFKEA